MSMDKDTDQEQRILTSWQHNTQPWIRAIEAQSIESRRLVTDAAIIATLEQFSGAGTLLDIGCGEGWLCRQWQAKGYPVTGIDAMPDFIQQAGQCGVGHFLCVDYDNLTDNLPSAVFDLAVCNFSLLGKDSSAGVIAQSRALLKPGGHLVVQTLHPLRACGDQPYTDGWREGSWAGFSDDFSQPAPWYFRTQSSWVDLFIQAGFQLVQLTEPLDPRSGRPLSLILVGQSA